MSNPDKQRAMSDFSAGYRTLTAYCKLKAVDWQLIESAGPYESDLAKLGRVVRQIQHNITELEKNAEYIKRASVETKSVARAFYVEYKTRLAEIAQKRETLIGQMSARENSPRSNRGVTSRLAESKDIKSEEINDEFPYF